MGCVKKIKCDGKKITWSFWTGTFGGFEVKIKVLTTKKMSRHFAICQQDVLSPS